MKNGYKNIILHIVGSSPKRTHVAWYARKIKKMVNEIGLSNNIIFHGEVLDMVSIREKMDVELMCAICETFGRVTVEGMRSGLALIGSNTGGTPEIINDKNNGLLYKQGDEEDLAQKIEELYTDRKKLQEIAENGYQFAQKNFTAEKNIIEVWNVFKNIKMGTSEKNVNGVHKRG